MLQERADAAGVIVGKAATYGGGASALWFGLSASELAAFIGAAVAVLGYATQVFYNRRKDRREAICREEQRAEHLARMRSLAGRKE